MDYEMELESLQVRFKNHIESQIDFLEKLHSMTKCKITQGATMARISYLKEMVAENGI